MASAPPGAAMEVIIFEAGAAPFHRLLQKFRFTFAKSFPNYPHQFPDTHPVRRKHVTKRKYPFLIPHWWTFTAGFNFQHLFRRAYLKIGSLVFEFQMWTIFGDSIPLNPSSRIHRNRMLIFIHPPSSHIGIGVSLILYHRSSSQANANCSVPSFIIRNYRRWFLSNNSVMQTALGLHCQLLLPKEFLWVYSKVLLANIHVTNSSIHESKIWSLPLHWLWIDFGNLLELFCHIACCLHHFSFLRITLWLAGFFYVDMLPRLAGPMVPSALPMIANRQKETAL